MKPNQSVTVEFDFDYSIRKTIEKSKSIFDNLSKRYPNDYELGRAIRKIINEI